MDALHRRRQVGLGQPEIVLPGSKRAPGIAFEQGQLKRRRGALEALAGVIVDLPEPCPRLPQQRGPARRVRGGKIERRLGGIELDQARPVRLFAAARERVRFAQQARVELRFLQDPSPHQGVVAGIFPCRIRSVQSLEGGLGAGVDQPGDARKLAMRPGLVRGTGGRIVRDSPKRRLGFGDPVLIVGVERLVQRPRFGPAAGQQQCTRCDPPPHHDHAPYRDALACAAGGTRRLAGAGS